MHSGEENPVSNEFYNLNKGTVSLSASPPIACLGYVLVTPLASLSTPVHSGRYSGKLSCVP